MGKEVMWYFDFRIGLKITSLEGLLGPLDQLIVIFRPPTYTITMWVTYFHKNNTWESLLGSLNFLWNINLNSKKMVTPPNTLQGGLTWFNNGN